VRGKAGIIRSDELDMGLHVGSGDLKPSRACFDPTLVSKSLESGYMGRNEPPQCV
jgi:hypothetical protein